MSRNSEVLRTAKIGLIAIAVLAVAVLIAHRWFSHYGSSEAITAIGLPGPRADKGRECGYMWARAVGYSVAHPGDLVLQQANSLPGLAS